MPRIVVAILLLLLGSAGPLAAQRARSKRAKPRTLAPAPQFRPEELQLFFPNALEVVGPRPTKRTSVLAEGHAAAVPAGSVASMPSPPNADNATDTAWSSVVSADVLEAELKRVQLSLSAISESAAEFRAGGFQRARRELALAGTLLGVIADYDGPVRWKSTARDPQRLLLATVAELKEPTDAAQNLVRQRAELLTQLVRGEPIEATLKPQLIAPAARALLMQRLELAQRERLGPGTADRASFDEQSDSLAQEAHLVALLARLITEPSYEFAKDAGYQSHARDLGSEARSATQAIERDDFEAAQATVVKMGQSCERCHEDFRG